MSEEFSEYVNLADFDGLWEAEALKVALDRQWVHSRIVVDGPWWPPLLGVAKKGSIHVQVAGECYDEACRYLEPEQIDNHKSVGVPASFNH